MLRGLQQNEPSLNLIRNLPKNEHPKTTAAIVQELAKRLQESQVKHNKPYVLPMIWQEDKGLYPSDVKLNFAGPPELAAMRDLVSVFDNNMFATAWITICVLEAHFYAKAPRPTDSQLSMALEAIGQYHDKNLGYENSVMNFWPQVYNETTKTWQSTPDNLLRAFGVFDVAPVKLIEDFLKLIGLKDVEHFLESILSMRSTFEQAFHIPSDFDDTFVNLGLGALLKDLSKDLPGASSQWSAKNTNVTSVLDALRQYVYRPFSDDPNVNTIDTRTFYYMRHFLGEAADRKEDIALVPTWVQNIDEARTDYYKGVAMPFTMNNVDVTVAANTVYGLTSAVLSGVLPADILDDPLIRQVYVNTSSMIAHQISHHLYERPDLELTYYPSALEFYWFTARTFARLETAQQNKPLPPAMQVVYKTLQPALEKNMTSEVISKAKAMGQDMLYFDDFLGDGDVDAKNNTVVRGEDRLFTTSVAINALLTTWTVFDDVNRTNSWKKHTPTAVRTTVDKSVKFLNTYILQDTYKPWNVFFSGSAKGSTTLPFAYPANRIEYLNGTIIHDDQHFPKDPFFFGMRGFVPESQYAQQLKVKHFGMTTPTKFTNFNQPGDYFPFWSSPAYTYANAMLALARYDNIVV
ncbi:hypothetical protein V1264_019392 [Littorina saxatilis]|uniref:Uncharacterized protein n=2 Tax=Littorina saxatilis TaxID=31220 RepID=A0AAN9BK69_9CAEN